MDTHSYNIGCESFPIEWLADPQLLHSFNALRIVSILQMVFVFLGYADSISTFYIENQTFNITDFLQAPGAISLLTVIAAVALRYRGDGEQSILQAKIYSCFVGLDFFGWIARVAYNLSQFVSKYDTMTKTDEYDAIMLFSFQIFGGILLLVGLAKGLRIVRQGSQQHYTILASNHGSSSTKGYLEFRPLRSICTIQVAFTVFGAMIPLIATYLAYGDKVGVLTLLLSPGNSIFTIAASLFIFSGWFGHSRLTYYSILLMVDILTTLMRISGGVTYFGVLYPDGESKEYFFVHNLIWAAFPIFYWAIGIYIAYRTKIYLEVHKHSFAQAESVFSM